MRLILAGLCLLATVSALTENLAEKTVAAKKPIEKKCLDILTNTNQTLTERCEFFKCFEERFPCGGKYWIMHWGYKYCRRYADPEFIAKFTAVGKELLDSVNKCLPKQFEKFYKQKKPVRCRRLQTEAFQAQGKCYMDIQDKFCKAFDENKMLFVKVLDYSDLMSYESINMIKNAAANCNPKIDLLSVV